MCGYVLGAILCVAFTTCPGRLGAYTCGEVCMCGMVMCWVPFFVLRSCRVRAGWARTPVREMQASVDMCWGKKASWFSKLVEEQAFW